METWRVEVVNEAAKAEIDALPIDIRAKLLHLTEMMAAVGPQRMREPHVKPLRDKLWEIRMSGKDGIGRAIYVFSDGKAHRHFACFHQEDAKDSASGNPACARES